MIGQGGHWCADFEGGQNSSARGKRGGAKFWCTRFSKTRQPPPPTHKLWPLHYRCSRFGCWQFYWNYQGILSHRMTTLSLTWRNNSVSGTGEAEDLLISSLSAALQVGIFSHYFQGLRLPHRNDAKIAKNLELLDILACNSANRPSFQNPTRSRFGQRSTDVNSGVRFSM